MLDPARYPLFEATLAQFLGVTMALFGCIATLGLALSMRQWVGIGLPFLLAYGTVVIGFLFISRHNADRNPITQEVYMCFIGMYLYADVFLLPIMVSHSGGVKQSLFCPLFFAIPAMATVFVSRSYVRQIYYITLATLAAYIVVYWLPSSWIVGLIPPGVFYNLMECVILVGSVSLTVIMTLRVRAPL